jgi:hypothetical protein
MQAPTINCPKLNCNTLQQLNHSSQRRYQQIGTAKRNLSRRKAPVNRDSKEKPFKKESTSK